MDHPACRDAQSRDGRPLGPALRCAGAHPASAVPDRGDPAGTRPGRRNRHLAKPDSSNLDNTWVQGLQDLARRENTFVKISGMATEVSGSPHAYRFRAHVECVLETFGATRCMVGSGWPVSTLALEFARTCQLLDELTSSLSPAEYRQVWREISMAAYGLNISS
jgi:Amidohydrolase